MARHERLILALGYAICLSTRDNPAVTDSDAIAGLRSCWASYGYGDAAASKELAPEFILPDIEQLPGLIPSTSD